MEEFKELVNWLQEDNFNNRAVHHLFFNKFTGRWECLIGEFTIDHKRWRGEGSTIGETIKIALNKAKNDN